MLLNDLAIERIMKGRMSCFPADDGGGPGWPAGRKEARDGYSQPQCGVVILEVGFIIVKVSK